MLENLFFISSKELCLYDTSLLEVLNPIVF